MESVLNMVALAKVKTGDKMVDLGSGDGRIVIAFAREGLEAHGYDNNPILVWLSRRKIKRAGLQDRAFIHFQSFWRADLSRFSIVTLFGMSHIMSGLEKKLKKELPLGARVLSNAFRFPNWELADKKGAVLLFENIIRY
ncbi:MAG: class I SAM-dependent methyltransferase [Patescibacteria group bacterium]